MSELKATLTIGDGRQLELDVHRPVLGYDSIDVQSLVKNQLFT